MNSCHSEHNCSFSLTPSGLSLIAARSAARTGPRLIAQACLLAAGLALSAFPALALDEGVPPASRPSAALSDKAEANRDPSDPLTTARESFEHPVKYAIYSTAWHVSSNAGLRIMAHNQSDETVLLESVVFRDETGNSSDVELSLDMTIAPNGWSELQLPYQNLLTGNDCVDRTLQDDWRLVEISNYTLNPSIRGLIIENTRQFRIYQCVRSVRVSWNHEDDSRSREITQWLMYHFERIPLY